NEIMYHPPPTLEVPATLGTNTFFSMTNLWRYDDSGTDLGTAWRLPGYDDGAWPVGRALLYATTNNLPAPKNTPLALGPTTYYFRSSFVWTGVRAVLSMSLRHVVDDGVVIYLNGVEVHRFNLPAAPSVITYASNAVSSILNATLRGPATLGTSNLVIGTNYI